MVSDAAQAHFGVDRLMDFGDLVSSGMSAGVGFCFTNGNCVTSYRSVRGPEWAVGSLGSYSD
jgi:hypothetical protein